MSSAVIAAARTAACAEVGWRDADGALRALAFTPLVIDDTVVAALPFDRTSDARALAGATAAVLTCSDSRMALRGWTPLALPVRVTVEADRDGDWTWTGALDQLVRKYPPSRLLLDTPIQRREHWWYVPRWIVRLHAAGPVTSIPRRAPDDAVLFGDVGGRFAARCVALDDMAATDIRLTALDSTAPLDDVSAPAIALAHTFSIPDMQRWNSLTLTGVRHGPRLQVHRRDGHMPLDPPAGVLRRLSQHWQLERACRRALATDSSLSR